jgi:hypothetical protein
MPCRYDEPPPPTHAEIEAIWYRQFEHNSPLAEMMCSLISSLGDAGLRIWADNTPGLLNWWRNHQARDAAKAAKEAEEASLAKAKADEAAERRRKLSSALAKLTPEEQELLGIKG